MTQVATSLTRAGAAAAPVVTYPPFLGACAEHLQQPVAMQLRALELDLECQEY